MFLHELELLLQNGLIRGGDLSNAIVYVEEKVEQEELERLALIFNKKNIDVSKDGYLNNIALHYPNEAARHKLLDVVGDLMLIGMPIKEKLLRINQGMVLIQSLQKL